MKLVRDSNKFLLKTSVTETHWNIPSLKFSPVNLTMIGFTETPRGKDNGGGG